jgi:serine protease Do
MKILKTNFIKALIIALVVILLFSITGCIGINAEPAAPSVTAPAPKAETIPDWTPSISSDQANPVLPDFTSVLSKVKPSVVAINTELTGYDIFNRPYQQEAAGSGWILDDSGLVVTNNHVIEGANTISVVLWDGQSVPAEIIGTDALSDIAVLKINVPNLTKIAIGDTSKLEAGEWVLSVGNSLGLGITAKEGIISRVGVNLEGYSQESVDKLIETSAAINPGNSGGPLVNMRGEVIGITSVKISTTGVEGMGYAIRLGEALPIIQELIQKGYIVRPWLGVSLYNVDQFVKQQFNLAVDSGALVVQVSPGSPADQGGIKQGDVIVGFNDKEIKETQDVREAILASSVGSEVKITYWRDNNKSETSVTLSESPAPSQ